MFPDTVWCPLKLSIHIFYLDVHILFLEQKESNLERATWVVEARKEEIHYIIPIYYI